MKGIVAAGALAIAQGIAPRVAQLPGDSARRITEAALARYADSVRVDAERRAHAMYDSVLARNNAALVTSTGALSVYVTALGVLFGIGAIVAGYLIYRQGAEYRTRLDATIQQFDASAARAIEGYKAILNGFIAEKNAEIDQTRASLVARIETLAKSGETAVGETKERITAEIAHLRQERDALKPIALPAQLTLEDATQREIDRILRANPHSLEGLSLVNANLPPTAKPKNAVLSNRVRANVKQPDIRTCPQCRSQFRMPAFPMATLFGCPFCGADVPYEKDASGTP